MLETDGPYAGNPCSATDHAHHRNAADSVEMQWRKQAEFYATMRERGVFLHAPDDYLFEGGANKCVLGYAEMQFNLPRDEWLAIARTQLYDNTWIQTPTQGWMFAALEDYHGGGDAAAIEPFKEHPETWEWALASFIGAGVGTCYRGSRLFDTPEIERMVAKWASFWVRHRRILTEDILHVRRPPCPGTALHHVRACYSADDAEAMLYMVYNPTETIVQDSLRVSAYYTGMQEGDAVMVTEADDATTERVVNLGPGALTFGWTEPQSPGLVRKHTGTLKTNAAGKFDIIMGITLVYSLN